MISIPMDCDYSAVCATVSANEAEKNGSANSALPMPPPALVRAVTLIALQDPLRPGYSTSSSLQPRSFAAVFVSLHNPSNYPVSLQLQKVEVIAVDSHATQMKDDSFSPIRLMPGESRTLDLFLNQASNYGTAGLLKAIVIYEVEGKVQVAGSMAVPIRNAVTP